VLWEENAVAGSGFAWQSGWQIANLPIKRSA
jgi:hypothetical protein